MAQYDMAMASPAESLFAQTPPRLPAGLS